MDGIEPTVAHCFTGAGMAKPRVHLSRMHESEEPMERSYSEAMEYLKRHSSEMPRKRVDYGVPLGNSMSGTEVGILSTVATLCFASTLQVQAVGAIAPETATHGLMQAGNSKADTSNFWFGVVACIAALFTIIAAIVAVMQLCQSRRNQTVSAPMLQMLTMQRRSRVHYMIVEESTVHRIDDMV